VTRLLALVFMFKPVHNILHKIYVWARFANCLENMETTNCKSYHPREKKMFFQQVFTKKLIAY